MPTGKKDKKPKHHQRTRTGEFTDGDPGSHRSVDQPPPLSLSLSGQSPAPDNTSSPLSALTLSDRDASTVRVHRSPQHLGPNENSSQNARDPNSSAPSHHKSQRATVEEASDEDDRRQRGPRRTSSVHYSRHSESRHSEPEEVAIKLAVVAPTPTHGPRPASIHTASDRLPGSSPILSSSPYPLVNLIEEPDDSLRESEHRDQRNEKQRRNRADSVESAELHLAATCSLAAQRGHEESDTSHHSTRWNDRNLNAATDNLAREQVLHDSPEVFQRHRVAWARSEQQLRNFRVEEDRIVAEELYTEQLRESHDRELAEQIQRSQRKSVDGLAESTRVAERYRASEKEHNSTNPTRSTLDRGRDQSKERGEGATRQRIPDQGIDWDESGTPFEKGPAPSRGISVGLCHHVVTMYLIFEECPMGLHFLRKYILDTEVTLRFRMIISHRSSRRAALPIIDAPERRRRVAEAVDWEDDHQVAVETNCPHPIHCRRRPRSSVWQGYGYTCGVMSTVSLCESDSSADSHSDDSDPTYQPEKNYSQSEETDSAWEQDPSVTIEEVTLNVNDSQPLYGKTRSGQHIEESRGRRIMRLIGDQRFADLKAAEMKRRAEKARILLLQSEES
ncbi:hypothetical protein DFH09DRAFT_1092988 [Mycena vulgaris]|nr:hypothetical protein DFH09DRAFT_1092988 [Mycena vulgaris]